VNGCANAHKTGFRQAVDMEKWMVVMGIWAMCATCAVLFIRGATRASLKPRPVEARVRERARH
jgi:hypothetical protein